MVAKNFYDAIVIGSQLGPLVATALLARRGFRVLLLGHDDPSPSCNWHQHQLGKEPFLLASADSPAVRRILSELSLTQIFRQRSHRPNRAFQVVLPEHRIDFATDPELFSSEIKREFPESHRAIETFYTALDHCNIELDKVLGADLVVPPETFFERRDVTRAAVHDPFSRTRGPVSLFGELPEEHPFRRAVAAQVRWASHLSLPDDVPLPLVRLHRGWHQGSKVFDGGLQALKDLVKERIATHSSDVRPDLQAERIALRRGRVAGVRMAGQDEVTGCNFVIFGSPTSQLPQFVDVGQLGRKFNVARRNLRPALYRFTLNLVVKSAVIPAGMASQVLLLSGAGPLQEENCLHIEVTTPPSEDIAILSVGALLPASQCQSREYMGGMRERIISQLRWLIPFLEPNLLAVDSPHDGRPLLDVNARELPSRDQPGKREPSEMAEVSEIDQLGPFGIAGLPHRTGLKNLLLANRDVAPGLGLEGEFLTAWGAADIITRGDRRKKKFRRERWTNIDL